MLLEQLIVQNHVLENVLLSSRRAIAQKTHLIQHVILEVRGFIRQEKILELRSCYDKVSCDPLSVQDRFSALLERVRSYIDSYQSNFIRDYESLVICANQFDYQLGTNRRFTAALSLCTTLSEIDTLVESHGGQIDYEEDYLPVLNDFHSRFSFTRNLLRDAAESHSISGRLDLIIPSILDYLRHFSEKSVPRALPLTSSVSSRERFLPRCEKFLDRLESLEFDDVCELFQVKDHRLRTCD